jgi:enoyl-CoA hydratase
MSQIQCEQIGDTAVVRLARPPVNALNAELVHELRVAFEGYAADPPAGLVLTHDGPVFCAGVDVKRIPNYSAEQRNAMADEINAMITALYGMPTATAAAVGGPAIGAGFVLMLACDIRLVANAEIKLGLTEVTAGVPYPTGPLEVVRAELDATQQRQLVLTGNLINADDALACGLIDETPDQDLLLRRALELAQLRSSAPAYRVVKQQVRGPVLDRMTALPPAPW